MLIQGLYKNKWVFGYFNQTNLFFNLFLFFYIYWESMKNIHDSLGVKNMSDLVFKEIYGSYGTKNLTKE